MRWLSFLTLLNRDGQHRGTFRHLQLAGTVPHQATVAPLKKAWVRLRAPSPQSGLGLQMFEGTELGLPLLDTDKDTDIEERMAPCQGKHKEAEPLLQKTLEYRAPCLRVLECWTWQVRGCSLPELGWLFA